MPEPGAPLRAPDFFRRPGPWKPSSAGGPGGARFALCARDPCASNFCTEPLGSFELRPPIRGTRTSGPYSGAYAAGGGGRCDRSRELADVEPLVLKPLRTWGVKYPCNLSRSIFPPNTFDLLLADNNWASFRNPLPKTPSHETPSGISMGTATSTGSPPMVMRDFSTATKLVNGVMIENCSPRSTTSCMTGWGAVPC